MKRFRALKYLGWELFILVFLISGSAYTVYVKAEEPGESQAKIHNTSDEAAPVDVEPNEIVPIDGDGSEIAPAPKGAGFKPYEEELVAEEIPVENRVSLDLRNIDVVEALRFVAQKGNMNLAVSKAVSGRLFVLLNDVPLEDAFDIILLSNELAYEKQGEIFYVMTESEYQARYGRRFSDMRKVKIFHLNYAVPERVFNAIDALKSDVGRLLVDQESGTVLVVDTEDSLNKIEETINAFESRRNIQSFSLQYAKAEDLVEQLKTQLDAKGAGSAIADERSNQVVIQTFPERMETIAQLIQTLDKKTKEVLIVAKIIKVTLSDNLETQIEWEGLFQQFQLFPFDGGQEESFIGSHASNALARTSTSFIDDFVSIAPTTTPTAGAKTAFTEELFLGQRNGKDSFEVLLKFLRTIGKTKVLSSPRLTVVNNQEAKILVGSRQAYVTTTTTAGESSTTTAEEVSFIDVGIQLSVTPTINDDGFVTMKIKPEISSVPAFLTTPSGNQIPLVDTSEAETTVMVKDKTTIIIAGLRRDDYTEDDERVPFLGDIPVIGRLFRSYTDTKSRDELLVLLTPHIIGGDEFETGDPPKPENGMKGYRNYSDLSVNPEEKESFLEPISSFFKKMPFLSKE